MPEVNVNYSHVAALAAANFLVSWFWYSPAGFGGPWLKALGRAEARPLSALGPEERKRMVLLLACGALSSFLKVLVLAAAVSGLEAYSARTGAAVGLLAWLGFTLTSSLDTLWEGRKGVVLAINNGLFALTYILFGAVLALWR